MKSTLFTTLLGFASLTLSAPTTTVAERQSSLQQITDSYVFSISIGQFIDNRNAKRGPAELDWSSDGCSTSPDNPFGFDFINSCYRHDFAYRNFKLQSRFTSTNKARIDTNFKTDMYNQCKSESYRDACEATATVYYEAVKAFGRKRGVEVEGRGVVMERREAVGV